MVRKTREEALATRELLLDAAEKVFKDRGVGHASLAEVADAAGVTRGAIYHHFESKADLFKAMVRRAELPMDTAMEELRRTSAADPLRAMRELAIHALQHLAQSARTKTVFEVVFLRCEYTEELSAVEREHLSERQECHQRCMGSLQAAVDHGQLPADTDVDLAARMVYAFIGGVMRDWVQSPEDYDLAATAPAMIDLFIAGLKQQPPRRRQDSVTSRLANTSATSVALESAVPTGCSKVN